VEILSAFSNRSTPGVPAPWGEDVSGDRPELVRRVDAGSIQGRPTAKIAGPGRGSTRDLPFGVALNEVYMNVIGASFSGPGIHTRAGHLSARKLMREPIGRTNAVSADHSRTAKECLPCTGLSGTYVSRGKVRETETPFSPSPKCTESRTLHCRSDNPVHRW
jgi:hypothetical protein